MKRVLAVSMVAVLATVLLSGCGSQFSGKEVVTSPNGQIPGGAKAYSPDGNYYLCEIEPFNKGDIVVYNQSDDKEVQQWNLLAGTENEIKGLAWAPDSKRFAVMYHGGVKPGISVFEVGYPSEVGRVAIDKWYHFLAFKNAENVVVSVDGGGTEILTIDKVEKKKETLPSVITTEKKAEEKTEAVTEKILEKAEESAPSFYGRTDAVYSTHGSVSRGDKAYSPDKKHYVCEVEPYDEGNVVVFDTQANQPVQKWRALPNNNDLKGLAWSPDSKRVAVMYHGGMTPSIQVFELGGDSVVATANFSDFYHFMIFDKSGKALLLSESMGGEIKRVELQEVK